MNKIIGIRKESKYPNEKRTPLVPDDVNILIKKNNIKFIVQPSEKRIFNETQYEKVGAKISNDLSKCKIIIGIKEIPIQEIQPNKIYIFFSHTIKGQKHNMPMLMRLIDQKCSLIDYERIIDEEGKRLIFFGKYAGNAGLIDTLHGFGLRLNYLNIKNPFSKIKQTKDYNSLEEIKKSISLVGKDILANGIPQEISPLIIGITGYGNVASGVQELLHLLPVKEILPQEIEDTYKIKNNNIIYKVVFHEKHLYQNINNIDFNLHDFYTNPQNYKSIFYNYLPHISILLNCIYWDSNYPRILPKSIMAKLFTENKLRLKVIGDISCDINGSVETTSKATSIENPFYLYNPLTEETTDGYKGEGILTMAIDILPAELPLEASISFSNILKTFIPYIINANFNDTYENINLPYPIKKALILLNGELTPEYKYMEKFL